MNKDDAKIEYLRMKSLTSESVKTGLKVVSFSENVTSSPQKKPSMMLRSRDFYCLSHMICGDGYYWDPVIDKIEKISPGYGVFVSKSNKSDYGTKAGEYIEDSICFVGPVADSFFELGLISDGVVYFGNERPLLPIIYQLRRPTLLGQFMAHALLLKLLIELSEHKRIVSSVGKRSCIAPLLEELAAMNHRWTVEEMAEYCNVSNNYFRKLFLEHTGMKPKHYLDQLLLNRAIELVCTSDKNISDIAGSFGFGDIYYFFRRFKELTGMSPTQYRQRYGKNANSQA